jgi:hypothetical protein
VIAYRPSARQSAFHAALAFCVWYCAGYGSGKTTAGVMEAFSLAVVQHPGCEGIVAAPTYALLMQAFFTEWQRWIPRAWWQLKRDPLKGPHLLVATEAGPSTVWLRSTNHPTSNEGINASWLVYDEAPRERDRAAFDILAARVRRGYPGRRRRIAILGPPMTRSHWTAEEFGAGPGGARVGDMQGWSDGVRCVVRARTRDNPHLPADYETTLRGRPGASRGWCAQFLDAQFGALEGQVYEMWDRDVHVVPASRLAGRVWRHTKVGVDWGWEHPGAMLVGGEDGFGDIYVLHEEVHRHRVVDATRDGWGIIAASLVRAWRVESFHCDPSAPGHLEALSRSLRTLGVPRRVYPADNDVGEGIRRVGARLERAVERSAERTQGALVGRRLPALYVSDACVHTIGEIEGYARKRARDGAILEAPVEVGDDAMDALRYRAMASAA